MSETSKIKGYRELNESEIKAMNDIKTMGEELERMVEVLMAEPETDKRWVSIGRTDLQTGIMALVRSVAKPESF